MLKAGLFGFRLVYEVTSFEESCKADLSVFEWLVDICRCFGIDLPLHWIQYLQNEVKIIAIPGLPIPKEAMQE